MKNRIRQRLSHSANCAVTPKQHLVPPVYHDVQRQTNTPPTRDKQSAVSSMGPVHKAPLREPHASDFRRFMFQYLQHHGLHSRTVHCIADNGWRESTGAGYATCMRWWIQFCKETKKDKYDMNVDNCLEFFRFLDSKLKIPLSQLKLVRSFLSISRRLARKPYSDNEMIF